MDGRTVKGDSSPKVRSCLDKCASNGSVDGGGNGECKVTYGGEKERGEGVAGQRRGKRR
jgi:hypothetical protein